MEKKPEAIRPAENWNWLWGAILIFLGGAALLNQFVDLPFDLTAMFWAILFAGGAAAFYAVYLRNRAANWWAQIPAYVLFTVAVLIVAGTLGIDGKVIGVYVMLAIAAPFYYVYLSNHEHWWALIPAYVMTAVAGIIVLDGLNIGDWMVVYIMLAVAFPFYYVFFRNRKNWWALIPAGIMSLVAFGFAVASVQYIVPVALILVGLFLLGRQMLPRGENKPPQLPTSGPEADKSKTV